jgi:hypothetical protein
MTRVAERCLAMPFAMTGEKSTGLACLSFWVPVSDSRSPSRCNLDASTRFDRDLSIILIVLVLVEACRDGPASCCNDQAGCEF